MKIILCIAFLLVQAAAYSQDLVAINYSGPSTYIPYEKSTIELTVKNTGIVDITQFTYMAAFLATDEQSDASDLLLSRIYVRSMGAGQSITQSTDVVLQ